MSAILTMGRQPAQGPAIAHRALTALWKVWAAYTLKRAIADVASTSDRDYRAFGLDKTEILGALRAACMNRSWPGGTPRQRPMLPARRCA